MVGRQKVWHLGRVDLVGQEAAGAEAGRRARLRGYGGHAAGQTSLGGVGAHDVDVASAFFIFQAQPKGVAVDVAYLVDEGVLIGCGLKGVGAFDVVVVAGHGRAPEVEALDR